MKRSIAAKCATKDCLRTQFTEKIRMFWRDAGANPSHLPKIRCMTLPLPYSSAAELVRTFEQQMPDPAELRPAAREHEENHMRVFRSLVVAAVAALVSQGALNDAQAAEPVGVLECNVSGGVGFVITSSKALACVFRPVQGRPEYYVGTITRFGLDIGVTGPGQLVWTVLSIPGVRSRYPLAGKYIGASAEVTAGPGVGANALVGGSDRSFALQPVSVSAQTGVDLAAGVGELNLEPGPTP
jgi:hypothetical protein